MLQWALRSHPDLLLLPVTFEPANYAIALPQRSPWRERINVALLEIIQSDAWRAKVERYLGDHD